MHKITKKETEAIRKMVEEEFPDDPALQQVHIARKILAKEAEYEELSFHKYIRSLGKQAQDVRQRGSGKTRYR